MAVVTVLILASSLGPNDEYGLGTREDSQCTCYYTPAPLNTVNFSQPTKKRFNVFFFKCRNLLSFPVCAFVGSSSQSNVTRRNCGIKVPMSIRDNLRLRKQKTHRCETFPLNSLYQKPRHDRPEAHYKTEH